MPKGREAPPIFSSLLHCTKGKIEARGDLDSQIPDWARPFHTPLARVGYARVTAASGGQLMIKPRD